MYLSSLLIDTGGNPDRPRPGRQWLRNVYHVHQRLCMAFPSKSREDDDKHFLKPYDPEDFGNGQVHVERKPDSGFLFRIDPGPNGRAAILVQSAIKPNWDYAFHNAKYLLAAAPEWRTFESDFTKGQRFRFRLVASPTKKVETKSGPDGKRQNGRRVLVPDFFDWLIRKSDGSGFSIEMDSIAIQPGYAYFKKPNQNDQQSRLRFVRYDGILSVNEPARFWETITRGIGSGKAFGFGLLSVAPYRQRQNES